MAELGPGLAGVEAHDAPRAKHRRDCAHAELGRLLQRPVHAFTARNPLDQRDRKRGFRTACNALQQSDAHLAAGDRGNLGVMLAATPIEDREPVADTQPEHARDVRCRRLGQRGLPTLGQRRGAVHAGQSHVASLIPSRAVATSASICAGSMTYGGMK